MEIGQTSLLTKKQLAAFFGITTRSIENLQLNHGLPKITLGLRTVRYDLNAVLAWARAGGKLPKDAKPRPRRGRPRNSRRNITESRELATE